MMSNLMMASPSRNLLLLLGDWNFRAEQMY
jgi:hypothetical protein